MQRLGRDSGIYTPLKNETMETLIPVNFYYMLINAFCPWFLQLKRNEKMLSFEWKGWEMHLVVTTYKSNEVFCVIFTSTSLHKCLFLLCCVKIRTTFDAKLTLLFSICIIFYGKMHFNFYLNLVIKLRIIYYFNQLRYELC